MVFLKATMYQIPKSTTYPMQIWIGELFISFKIFHNIKTFPDSMTTLGQRWPKHVAYVGPMLAIYVGPMSYCSLARCWPNMLAHRWHITVCFYANVGTTLSQLTNANHLFGNVGPMLDFRSNHDYNVGPMLVQRWYNTVFWNANVGTTLFQHTFLGG